MKEIKINWYYIFNVPQSWIQLMRDDYDRLGNAIKKILHHKIEIGLIKINV